jgi:hypothetical protein
VIRIHCVPLQQRNLNRLAIVAMHHARPFAQNIHRANTRATRAKNIRIKNAHRRAPQIARGNPLDESWHVNMRGARRCARRVKAIQTAIGLNYSGLIAERRLQLAKPRA